MVGGRGFDAACGSGPWGCRTGS